MPTNNLAPKSKNYLSSIPPKMSERFGSAVLPYLQSVQGLFPPTNPYGQATSNFLLGQAPQAAQRMAEGYPNVLFNTSNPLGGKRIVNPVALDMAVALPIGTALKGAGLAGGGVAATFAGIGAKTANREALLVAERMKAAGAPDEEIHKATGWFFGSADGKPRFEIDDSGAQLTDKAKLVFTPDMIQLGGGKYQFDESAPDLMPHPELEAAYPFYKNIGVKSTSDFSGGSYSQFPSIYANDGQSRLIKISQSGDDARSTAFHELQHAIQRREGFARGGSPEMFSRGPMFNAKARNLEADLSRNLTGGLSAHPDEIIGSLKYGDANELNSIAQKHGFSGIDEAISFLKAEDIKRTPFGQYQRLAGEAEARLTQSRMDMTGAERAASYPPGMYDVPVGDQIVRYGEGPALATTPKVEANFSGTKILDAEGKPLVVYHGTDDVFDTFNPKLTRDIGSHFGAQEQAVKFGKNIMPVQLNIRNPLPMNDVFSRQDGLGDAWRTINDETNITPAERDKLSEYTRAVQSKWSDDRDADNSKIKEFKQFWKLAEKVIRRSGFDGIVYRNKVEGDFDSYVVFDPKQIKSAGPSFKKPSPETIESKTAAQVEKERLLADWLESTRAERIKAQALSPESQAIARYREIKGPKSVVRMEAALRTAGVPLPKNEPVAYIQSLVDRAHRRN